MRSKLISVLLVLFAGSASCQEVCPWPIAGAAPYGPEGDVIESIKLRGIPEPYLSTIIAAVQQDTPSETTRVTREGLQSARFKNFRNINFKGGLICKGTVDTHMWHPAQSQIAKIYAAGPWSVVLLPGCGNVGEATDILWRAPVRTLLDTARDLVAGNGLKTPQQAVTGRAMAVDEPHPLALLGAAMVAGWLINKRRR